jgi:hypothetical protein
MSQGCQNQSACLERTHYCKRGNGNDDNNDQTSLVTEELETLNQVETVNQIELDIQPNTRVSCVYEHNWYIGQVENVDKDDNEVEGCHHFHFLFYKECVLSRHAD